MKAKVKSRIRGCIQGFFKNKTVKTSHVLDRLFPAERRVRSLIGGLETSLGTVWQAVAEGLAESNGFELREKELLRPSPFPKKLSQELYRLKHLRENKESWIPMLECVESLKEVIINIDRSNLTYAPPPRGKGIDVCFFKHGTEYIFDTKTNQINQRGGLDLNLQLLEWYSFKLCKNPLVEVEARIAFPFNPYSSDWWKNQGSRVYPLTKDEGTAWVENEFWDFCSGHTNTWKKILEIFDELGKEDFAQQFNSVFYLK